ncbi:aldehyde dehydrogenase family protein [Burkholderia dolosa]|uniref:Aldehyde dehydrogenase family protein n=1 Tax=Burkholderia dolosa TaxID=152500 RepID=A0A892ID31_9BURK|nr:MULTISPECIES: aldehyde dehydrogenase family protein [Burkholderia]AKE05162.1 aldehyde dehydrogenase [Burkholderia cepacia]AJY10768.1 aldehyde dehydrogenase family protein [Burkholderia dolosa AU0158]AYZ94535.1 aldehyde dehydrogenase family protein [Burkholderia dolosa]EAY71376.1 NAD-dependent aldehyde dehydrogenase [Burkholderia dolosa AU0158]ETP63427.1 betaine-aldehyde dehydrogenase [Burkholderia dolosa PC543]
MSATDLSRCAAPLVPPAARIAGVPVAAQTDGAGAPIFNASTGAAIGWQAFATEAHVDAAVRTAHDAFAGWRDTPPVERGRALAKIAERVEAERERLAALQMQVSGKPRFEADADVGDVAATFAYYAALCEDPATFAAEPVALPNGAVAAERFHDAVGVAALIVPWNFPMVTTAWKLAPALAAGCTVVLKPSELTSPAEHALLDIVAQAGVPAGVVNVVNGGADVGALLTAHPLVDKISFTGSTAAGRNVMRAAAHDMKRVTLELGGKSSLIVRDDADVDVAVSLAVAGAFTNAGQMCSATARILVHDSVYRRFMAAFETAVRALVVAPPDMERAAMGPMISAAQRARVHAMLERGIASGARVAFTGRVADTAGDGFFIAPVVIAEPAADNVLWTDEVFGPVACVKSFRTDDDAIALANDTRYGLVATVVTRDAAAAKRFQARLRAGLVWINAPQLIYPHVCWGGLGLSGIGRELGMAGLRSYQELRHAMRAVD